MKQPSDESGFFPSFTQEFADEAVAKAAADRIQRVKDHRESMANCWEEWDANRTGIVVGTRCQVNQCCATLAEDAQPYGGGPIKKAGEVLYTYMAPCVITEVIDEETWLAVIDYPQDCHCAGPYNGIKLRLDILDIWPPVQELSQARRA